MAATFECQLCGARVHLEDFQEGKPPECQHVPERMLDEKPPRRMRVVD